MRRFAFSLTVLALSLTATIASADDFSALLADLSFGDEPALGAPMSIAGSEPADELKPAPTGLVMPELASVPESDPAIAAEIFQESALESALEIAPESTPAIASLQDPVPVAVSDSDQVNLDAVFALQEIESVASTVPAQPVGFPTHGCAAEEACCDADPGIICIPRTAPVLPSSTLHQYFRSHKCNTNIWDGYRQQCPSSHKHIHGTCDCLSKSRNRGVGCGTVLPAPKCNDCGSCDSTCD